jgi:hypothetical protein
LNLGSQMLIRILVEYFCLMSPFQFSTLFHLHYSCAASKRLISMPASFADPGTARVVQSIIICAYGQAPLASIRIGLGDWDC